LAADGGTQGVKVTFDTTGLKQAGVYYAVLKVNSGDPLHPLTSIPITMTVQGAALPTYLPLIQKKGQ
jgi:hypothetical protein